jgi:hypothetical protein
MACPRCGALDYRLIAPGFVECLGVVPVPNPSPPRGELTAAPCRTRYHVIADKSAAATPSCRCGLFAIGACPQCGTPYCGDHSWLRKDQRLCAPCARASDDRAATLKRQEDETRQAQLRAQHASEKASVPTLAQEAFGARPRLVRTFRQGYHRGLAGRLSAPKVRVIYAGTCYNRCFAGRVNRQHTFGQRGGPGGGCPVRDADGGVLTPRARQDPSS